MKSEKKCSFYCTLMNFDAIKVYVRKNFTLQHCDFHQKMIIYYKMCNEI